MEEEKSSLPTSNSTEDDTSKTLPSLYRSLPMPWTTTDYGNSCQICGELLLRSTPLHKCRICAMMVCSHCSALTVRLGKNHVRVCNHCRSRLPRTLVVDKAVSELNNIIQNLPSSLAIAGRFLVRKGPIIFLQTPSKIDYFVFLFTDIMVCTEKLLDPTDYHYQYSQTIQLNNCIVGATSTRNININYPHSIEVTISSYENITLALETEEEQKSWLAALMACTTALQRQQREDSFMSNKNSSMELQLTLVPNGWDQPDENHCAVCFRSYSFFHPRRHCKICKLSVCRECSPHRRNIPSVSTHKESRVCSVCVMMEGKKCLSRRISDHTFSTMSQRYSSTIYPHYSLSRHKPTILNPQPRHSNQTSISVRNNVIQPSIEEQRKALIGQLLSSEATHLGILKSLLRYFIEPIFSHFLLSTSSVTYNSMNENQNKLIQGNLSINTPIPTLSLFPPSFAVFLQSIYHLQTLHKQLQGELALFVKSIQENKVEEPEEDVSFSYSCLNMGVILPFYVSLFQLYQPFFQNYHYSINLLSHSPQLVEFINAIETNKIPSFDNNSIVELFNIILQYPSQFQEQIDSILQSTSPSNTDRNQIYESLQKINPIIESLNEILGIQDVSQELMNLEMRFHPRISLMQRGRELIRSQELTKLTVAGPMHYFFHLFTDMLIYSVQESNNTLHLREIIVLKGAFINILPGDRNWHAIKIESPLKSFVICFENENDKNTWLEDFSSVLSSLHFGFKLNDYNETWASPLSIPTWKVEKEKETNNCTLCYKPFTVMFRKHHCHSCGDVICSECSPDKTQIPGISPDKPVRVCVDCYQSCVKRKEILENYAEEKIDYSENSEMDSVINKMSQNFSDRHDILRVKYLHKKMTFN